jgi:hypothetical protein
LEFAVSFSRSLRALLILYIALAGLLLVACGGGDEASEANDTSDQTAASAPASDPSEHDGDRAADPATTATDAAAPSGQSVSSEVAAMAMVRTQELDSLRFAMVIAMSDLPGYDGEVELTMDGAVDQANGTFEIAIDFGAFMQAMAAAEGQSGADATMVAALFGDGVIEMRQVGETAYMRWPALSALFGAETDWVSFPAEDSVENSFDLGELMASQDLLDELGSVGVVTNLGGETLFGDVSTIHYEALIDYGKAYDSLTGGAPVPLDSPDLALVAGVAIPFGLWIDDDGLMRRMTMEFDTADLDLPASEADEAPGTIYLQFDILEVGGAVVVQAPPASDVTDMTDAGGGQLFGDLF